MTRQYDDRDPGYCELFAELQEKRFRAQHDPEYLTRLRSSEGVSFSLEGECQDSRSSEDTPDSSDSSSPDASRWEWCAGGPARPTSLATPTPVRGTNRLWRTVQHLYERVRRR